MGLPNLARYTFLAPLGVWVTMSNSRSPAVSFGLKENTANPPWTNGRVSKMVPFAGIDSPVLAVLLFVTGYRTVSSHRFVPASDMLAATVPPLDMAATSWHTGARWGIRTFSWLAADSAHSSDQTSVPSVRSVYQFRVKLPYPTAVMSISSCTPRNVSTCWAGNVVVPFGSDCAQLPSRLGWVHWA